MDDPWATPTWSAPPKATGAASMVMPDVRTSTPAPAFDEGDAWGVPATHATDSAHDQRGVVDDAAEDEDQEESEAAETPGWGHEAEDWAADPAPKRESLVAESPAPDDPEEAVTRGMEGSKSPVETGPTDQDLGSAGQAFPPSSPTVIRPETPPGPSRSASPASPKPAPLSTSDSAGFGSHPGQELTLPKSPSFGDDFGGFSAGPAFPSNGDSDPWGAGPSTMSLPAPSTSAGGWGPAASSWGGAAASEEDRGWGGEMSFEAAPVDNSFGQIMPEARTATSDDGHGDDDGWGSSRPSRPVIPPSAKPRGDDDWEEAQRKIRIKQERAPQEQIDGLTKAWTDLLESVITSELDKMTGAEELQFEETVNALSDDTADRLRSFSVIPPEINTYPPVISSLMTHERYVYALQRPNPTPSTSLLHTSVSRRPTRVDPLSLSDSSAEPSWGSRSMLGEPDAPPQDKVVQQEEAGSSRWSFWGKRPAPQRQLTTSGGAVLEIKAMSPTPSMDRASSENRPPSLPQSRAPSIVGSIHPSRPASPASSFSPSIAQDSTSQAPAQALPSQAQAPPVQAAPSAVSRFFGRLGRKASASTTSFEMDDDKDLELTQDDLSYLSEVPSLSQPRPEEGVGDLLAMVAGRNEQIAGLESLLSSKPTALPKPLAPPPMTRDGSGSRSASGRFVAKMKAPAPSDMDLLGGLDFDGPVSPAAQSPSVTSPSPSPWDDFLASGPTSGVAAGPDKAASHVQTPTAIASRAVSSIPLIPSRSGTPTIAPPVIQPPATPSSFTRPTASAHSDHLRADDTGDFGDFDDFGTPSHAASATFDDFGDFGSFDSQAVPGPSLAHKATPVNSHTPIKAGPSDPAISTPTHHTGPGSLDHTPTINLMSGASASKGKRWPAPPSPIAPVLAPPPKPGTAPSSAGFPFLSPPPPGRPNSRNGTDLLGGDAAVPPPRGLVSSPTQAAPSSMFGDALSPSAVASPPVPKPATPAPAFSAPSQNPATAKGPPGKGGLSAQDLSFFDSL
ncbi:hypothetical protein IAU60_004827 [Kwoniella sp. DSM 27419]